MKMLYRSRSDRRISGVCGGLADYFSLDPSLVRILAVISIFLTGLGFPAYILMSIIVPKQEGGN